MENPKKAFAMRAFWTENLKSIKIEMQKQGISHQEALGILEMAKEQLLAELRKSMKPGTSISQS